MHMHTTHLQLERQRVYVWFLGLLQYQTPEHI